MKTVNIKGVPKVTRIFEQLYGVESVSTEKILTLANRWSIPIYTIDDTNIDQILPQLDTFDIVKENIIEAVEMGWTAVVPQRNIQLNQWYGAGWIIMDPDTGSAGYLLAGYLVSGSELMYRWWKRHRNSGYDS